MSGIAFDDATSKRLERMYGGRDLVHRRQLVRNALQPKSGDRILDIGCGPGFYEAEIAPTVGDSGLVLGVDSSEDMLALARARCADLDNVEFRQGAAPPLPVEDGAFDGLLCVQVLEYVPDTLAALKEMHRALRPGGSAVVWDVDWATVSWHTSDRGRMDRVLHVWDEHLTHPSLPRTLASMMRANGFANVRVTPYSFVSEELSADTYGGQLVGLIKGFASGRAGVTDEELDGWAAEQRELAARNEFFFAVTQFCFTAIRAS